MKFTRRRQGDVHAEEEGVRDGDLLQEADNE